MQTIHIDEASYSDAYGIRCAALTKPGRRDSFYPTFCKIAPGAATTAHAHVEPEVFFIVRGSGSMCVGGRSRVVRAGELVHIPPFAEHTLANTGDDELTFVSVYGEDVSIPDVPRAALITAAPPTPNGPLHLGHISGPYLAADVMRRYLTQRGALVHSHCGTDDHQNYVDEAARSNGKLTAEFGARMRERINAGFGATAIAFDEMIEPRRDADYQARVRAFAARAEAAGIIELATVSMPHCARCEMFLVDALAVGECPSCGAGSHGGCESCGVVVPPYALVKPHCARCGAEAGRKQTQVHTFALHEIVEPIRQALRHVKLSQRVRGLVERVASSANATVMVTQPGGSGIRMPGFPDETLHVWFEAAAHYESFAHEWRTWIHCFGFDNAFHYLLFIPAILRAMNPRARLPDVVVTNEFLTLEGSKFSTSRKHAIWADDFAADADHVRLFLALNRPVSTFADFSQAAFEAFAHDLGTRIDMLVAQAKDSTGEPQSTLLECNRFTRDLELFYSPATLDLRRAARRILELIDVALHCDGDRLRLRTLATVMAPLMPATADRLAQALGTTTDRWVSDWSAS